MLKVKTLALVIVAFLLFIAHTNSAAAANYYVSPSGNDSNVGTLSQPFKTIKGNVWRMQPGDTMFLRGGTYQDDNITPIRSGQVGNPISFKAYNNETPIIQGTSGQAVYIYDKDYFVIDGIDIQDIYGHWVSIWLSSNVTIKNCNFSNVTRDIIGLYIINSDHITIQDCVMDKVFDPATAQDKDMIFVESSHYNLFERLTLTRAPHSLIGLQNSTFNVIRNNVLKNEWQKNIGLGSPTSPTVLGRNLVENNKIYGSRAAIAPGFTGKGAMGVYINQKGNIVRKNEIYDNSNFGILADGNNSNGNTPVNFNKIYNNTIYKNGLLQGYDSSAGLTITDFYMNINMGNNKIKNNIISENAIYNAYVNSQQAGLENNSFEGNCFYKPDNLQSMFKVLGLTGTTLSSLESAAPTLVNRNVQANPLFMSTNLSSPNFNLQSGSGCIDKGVALTTTTSSGSGTSVTVADAGYFTDGFGIVNGDQVQIGNNQPVTITAINYNTNTLTVDRSLSWTSGQSVNLPYQGSAPDTGAYESALVSNTPNPTANATPATTTSPQAIPGDANGDLKIDGVDYIVWLNHYNQTISGTINGNFNNDAKVDGLDYIIWLNAYDTTTPAPTNTIDQINVNGGNIIRSIGANTTLNTTELQSSTLKINVPANTQSVKWTTIRSFNTTPVVNIDNTSPYTIVCDGTWGYCPWDVGVGTYNITADVYDQTNATGNKIGTSSFQIIVQ